MACSRGAQADVDLLHFRRAGLAAQMVSIFEHRLQPALILFAPEQKGKTTFLQQDFVPLAREHGFLVATADLLAEPDNPELAIAGALQEAIRQARSQNPRLAILRSGGLLLRRARAISNACRGHSVLPSVERRGFRTVLEEFNQAGKGRALLIIEAVEHLTTQTVFDSFTAKLRALLQAPGSSVPVVFTGASRRGHADLFRRFDAPFFRYGFDIDFPNLGREFACQLGERFKEATGEEWDVDQAYRLFIMHGEMPSFLRSLYVTSLSRNMGVEDAAEVVLETHLR